MEQQVGMRQADPVLASCNINGCTFVASHIRRLGLHIAEKHGHEYNLLMPCYVDGCMSRFRNSQSFRMHMQRYHKDLWYSNLPERHRHQQPEFIWDPEMGPAPLVDGIDQTKNSSERNEVFVRWVKASSLRLRLAFEHEHEVPASKVRDMHSAVKDLVLGFQDQMQGVIQKRIDELGVNDAALTTLLCAESVLTALNCTKTDASSWFTKNSYVQPKRIRLLLPAEASDRTDANADADDPDDRAAGVAELGEFNLEDEPSRPPSGVMHYVPILDTLKAYLAHDDVVESINCETLTEKLSRFPSGSLFHRHPLFRDNPNALRIILYTDEVEICNPLGSHRGVHKLTVVYFSVGNIEQHHLSSLSSIHLALICEYPNVKHYTYAEVFKPLIADLKVLETDGIRVTTLKGEQHFWKGGLCFIAADNATQHAIAGFRGCFSSGRICRFCMADYSNLQELLCENDCVMRTRAGHARHLEAVAQDESLIPVYGVTGPSPFFELQSGVCLEVFAPDPLHEILEGLAPLHITLLIRKLHTSKVLSLTKVRRALHTFQYGRNDKINKPNTISDKFMQKKYQVVGSAAEKWVLFRVFSLAVGPLVPEGNEHWSLFLLGNRILDIIFAPVLDREWLPELSILVEEHQRLWVRLYPGTATFKWHVIIHYRRLAEQLGSLRLLWTMRFEAHHQFFKRTARKLRNFKCISKTLCERFQRRRCVQMAGDKGLPPDMKLLGPQISMQLRNLPQVVCKLLCSKFACTDTSSIVEVKSLVVRGLRCHIGDYVVLSVNNMSQAQFFKIAQIYLWEQHVALVGFLATTVSWNVHLHAYCIQVSSAEKDLICIESDEVCSPQTLDAYIVNGSMYIKVNFKPTC